MAVPPGTDDLITRLEALQQLVRGFDWRVQDLVIAPVSRIDAGRDS